MMIMSRVKTCYSRQTDFDGIGVASFAGLRLHFAAALALIVLVLGLKSASAVNGWRNITHGHGEVGAG